MIAPMLAQIVSASGGAVDFDPAVLVSPVVEGAISAVSAALVLAIIYFGVKWVVRMVREGSGDMGGSVSDEEYYEYLRESYHRGEMDNNYNPRGERYGDLRNSGQSWEQAGGGAWFSSDRNRES